MWSLQAIATQRRIPIFLLKLFTNLGLGTQSLSLRGRLKSPVCYLGAWHTLREASYGNHSWVVLADL